MNLEKMKRHLLLITALLLFCVGCPLQETKKHHDNLLSELEKMAKLLEKDASAAEIQAQEQKVLAVAEKIEAQTLSVSDQDKITKLYRDKVEKALLRIQKASPKEETLVDDVEEITMLPPLPEPTTTSEVPVEPATAPEMPLEPTLATSGSSEL